MRNMWLRAMIAFVLTTSFLPHGGAGLYSPDYKFGTSRLRFMSQANSTAAGTLAQIDKIMVPTGHQGCWNPRFVFSTVLGIDGSTNPEQGLGNSRTIDGFAIQIDGGTPIQGTIGGQASYVQSDLDITGGISDPIPVYVQPDDANVFVILLEHVADTSSKMPGLLTTNLGAGEGTKTAALASSLAANLASGSGITTYSSHADGPMQMLCQGMSGERVEFLAGDSICHYDNDNASGDARGNAGFLDRGLDDNASSARMVGANFCVSGQSQDSTSDGAITDGHFGYRIALINAIAALNASGDLPMDTIILEHGTNDSGVNLVSTLLSFAQILHQQFPGVPVVKTTLTPQSTNDAGYLWNDTADQIPSTNYGAGQYVPLFNAALVAGTYQCPLNSGQCFDGFIDIGTYAWNSGVWNFPGVVSTTFAASSLAGASSISLVGVCPPIGTNLVLGVGTLDVESKTSTSVGYYVGTATPSGGNCTVTFAAQQNGNATDVTQAHTLGDPVADAYTFGSPHPNKPGHIYIAGAIIAAKNAGIIH